MKHNCQRQLMYRKLVRCNDLFYIFQLCVQENYRNNPFHNFRHSFCVTQMMYGMINLCRLWDHMSRESLGILMTACVCHDLDHPGYNNTLVYLINICGGQGHDFHCIKYCLIPILLEKINFLF